MSPWRSAGHSASQGWLPFEVQETQFARSGSSL